MPLDTPAAASAGTPDLEALYGPATPLAVAKVIDRIDANCRLFISHSPFLCLSTADAEGKMDVSPRGDPPGFVKVLDDKTLALPDRLGNNRIDSLKNIRANPEVGLIFFVPGVGETLRVNGTARISEDPALLESMAFNGKAPKSALLITVREAFIHCAKALKRSSLWEPSAQVPKGTIPSLARMIKDQIDAMGETVEAVEQRTEQAYKERLY
ncbi:MAG: pyridoxamine 5'-phosphate oxidase family protein [Alphaproteobacteria bacterium]|nr:pyridoxamine 5'-phosphate oxidase family protein [Alphaproteobacteria bacterium]MBU0797572.1 pyridoxamine 5'-phosphate oxidase family protein [Alphaproteobacteria bacterium]MBU0885636.1 pyridoxamine 5'-phosphate oxidase family protein [Alphaproteobacteria bacterium]MBU1812708.1 pyridoxamine 5'-phosphate oxidase family protein [Alphaproteobacteria bacterium]MBU2090093.1 pyridoxamine 5'-phosphate oxidase family protein [Alphaproteobacteria bacterium]